MRTTVTVQDELYERLRERARQTSRSLTAVLNETIALGLIAASSEIPRKVDLPIFSLGLKEGLSYDNIGELLDQLEGPGN
jgi:predicted transcriptional regulator